VAAFRQGLSETGYVEGQTVAIEYRWAEGRFDRLPALAADLVDRKVDAIVTSGGPVPARAAKTATATIPIVSVVGGDPIADGLITSLARPGGNLTGATFMMTELMPKLLELVSELVPQAKVIVLLVNPNDAPSAERTMRDVEEASRVKGRQLHILKAGAEGEIDAAFAILVQLQAGALFVGADAFFNSRREQLVALAARYAVRAIYEWREFAAAGGLISYGPSITAAYRQVGNYTGRILKGEKPADLPVQQPTTFELVVNLNTAKELGLIVPPSILARADEVIELNETSRVIAATGRRDEHALAPGAAEVDAGDRLSRRHLFRTGSAVGRVPPAAPRDRLGRRAKLGYRIPLGGGPL
jgi:putative ABC transport system substrate-binding protein